MVFSDLSLMLQIKNSRTIFVRLYVFLFYLNKYLSVSYSAGIYPIEPKTCSSTG